MCNDAVKDSSSVVSTLTPATLAYRSAVPANCANKIFRQVFSLHFVTMETFLLSNLVAVCHLKMAHTVTITPIIIRNNNNWTVAGAQCIHRHTHTHPLEPIQNDGRISWRQSKQFLQLSLFISPNVFSALLSLSGAPFFQFHFLSILFYTFRLCFLFLFSLETTTLTSATKSCCGICETCALFCRRHFLYSILAMSFVLSVALSNTLIKFNSHRDWPIGIANFK